MIVKLLGALDIFIGVCFFIFCFFGIIPFNFIAILGGILLVKGILFGLSFNVMSILDIVSALIILLSANSMPKIIVVLVAIFLLQKGIFSLNG